MNADKRRSNRKNPRKSAWICVPDKFRQNLYIALDRCYITQAQFDEAYDLADKVSRQIYRIEQRSRGAGEKGGAVRIGDDRRDDRRRTTADRRVSKDDTDGVLWRSH